MSTTEKTRIAIGGDHAGFLMKSQLADFLQAQGYVVSDCGTDSEGSCDFPDFAESVALEILENRADRGLLVCGSGVGVSVAANKIPGIRASL